MSHEVETMFYTREKPWHGLGERVEDAICSADALKMAGLNWTVLQKPIFTEDKSEIPGFKANVRSRDGKVLGIVTDRYKVVQNIDAFNFTDSLLGKGVRYETAGSLMEGRRVWLLARMPEVYKIADDDVESYLVFSNTHDGSGGIKVAITPIRVVCQNTLNLALHDAKRIWSTIHVGSINEKLDEARKTLLYVDHYMYKLKVESEALSKAHISDKKVIEYIEQLIPMSENPTKIQENNIDILRTDLKLRYFEAPDLVGIPKNGWRFINAVSDFATHVKPLRKTSSYKENLFMKTIDGNPLIDKAYELISTLV
jgi:phage/plasmid-like protein (TIGR03299 family)